MSLFQTATYSDTNCTVPAAYLALLTTVELCSNISIIKDGSPCTSPNNDMSMRATCENGTDVNGYVNGLTSKPSLVTMYYSDAACSLTPTGFIVEVGATISTDYNGTAKSNNVSFVPKTCFAKNDTLLSGMTANFAYAKMYSSGDGPTGQLIAPGNDSTRSQAISIVALLPILLIGMFAFF